MTLREANSYKLSQFIKIGEMLVVQKAVQDYERGRIGEPLNTMNDMRECFMIITSCTPSSWAVQLRSFEKDITRKIRWRPSAVRQYRQRIETFLESLLLLVHLTADSQLVEPRSPVFVIPIRHFTGIYSSKTDLL
jgi:hypothetical protein